MAILLLTVLALLTVPVAATAPALQAKPVVVVLETEAGNITLEIDAVRAPITSANFLKYVDAGIYDGARFARTVNPQTETNKTTPINVIVGDLDPSRAGERFPAIPLERTSVTGLKHLAGSLAMGRMKATDSAQTEFFVCVEDTPGLDFGGMRNADGQGFAVFGRVSAGVDVVTKFWMMPAEKQRLTTPVKILKAYRK